MALRFHLSPAILYGGTYITRTRYASSTMADLPNLGPLPQFDDNARLQEESFKALRNALPVRLFGLREEPRPDAGVDWCLELRMGGQHTGMRAHIQVKGCGKAEANADGSISFSADVSNLSYLLNVSSPLYVLYVEQANELRYVWVRDEVNRINGTNPKWIDQQTVTLRFTAMLDERSAQDIHEGVRRDAQITRQVQGQFGVSRDNSVSAAGTIRCQCIIIAQLVATGFLRGT